jgi:hypothetical protein
MVCFWNVKNYYGNRQPCKINHNPYQIIQVYISAILEWQAAIVPWDPQNPSCPFKNFLKHFLLSSCIQITPSFMKQNRTTLLHLQLVSSFVKKIPPPKGHLVLWICENITMAGRGALFLLASAVLKGTCPFEILDISPMYCKALFTKHRHFVTDIGIVAVCPIKEVL